jgi:hypothetical protein
VQAEPNRRALLVLNENLTAGFYEGEYKPFLMSNTVFRLGGAAVLLSNRCVKDRDVIVSGFVSGQAALTKVERRWT